MYKKFSAALLALAILVTPAVASAHVVVKPAEVTVGSFTTFNVGVPNEKDIDVTSVKLDIPAGLNYVTPTVKNGWTISTEKSGDGEDAVVTSITWSGGTIPAGLRDDFTFSAQAPAKTSSVNWKAYETYADGTVVHWDQTPTSKETEDADAGPYSITKVVNDLATAPAESMDMDEGSDNTLPLILAGLAIIISVAGLLYKKPVTK